MAIMNGRNKYPGVSKELINYTPAFHNVLKDYLENYTARCHSNFKEYLEQAYRRCWYAEICYLNKLSVQLSIIFKFHQF